MQHLNVLGTKIADMTESDPRPHSLRCVLVAVRARLRAPLPRYERRPPTCLQRSVVGNQGPISSGDLLQERTLHAPDCRRIISQPHR